MLVSVVHGTFVMFREDSRDSKNTNPLLVFTRLDEVEIADGKPIAELAARSDCFLKMTKPDVSVAKGRRWTIECVSLDARTGYVRRMTNGG